MNVIKALSMKPFDTPGNDPISGFITVLGSSNMVKFLLFLLKNFFVIFLENFFF